MSLSTLERRVIACLPDIDPGGVGEVISIGAQSIVRSYDVGQKRQVIKLPIFHIRHDVYAQTVGRFLGQRIEQAKAELDLCATYFEPFMVPTRIVAGARPEHFCIIQDRIELDKVTPRLLAESHPLVTQLDAILEANRRMMAEHGQWLDVMGWKLKKFLRFVVRGTPYLENIALDTRMQRLRLFDFGLFPVPGRSRLPMSTYYRLLLHIQRRNMRGFGYSFDGRP